jgi:hypothetical protein
VSVCVCVCVRERERERESLYVNLCVCVHMDIAWRLALVSADYESSVLPKRHMLLI